MSLKIYTDGCCLNNQERFNYGGWAFVAVQEPLSTIKKSNGETNTTNQRMELVACIEAMKFGILCEKRNIEIITDSSYVVNCVKDGWYLKWVNNGWKNSKKEPVKNKDLWKIFISYLEIQYFEFTHVKGHSGNIYNEEADKLAKEAAMEMKLKGEKHDK